MAGVWYNKNMAKPRWVVKWQERRRAKRRRGLRVPSWLLVVALVPLSVADVQLLRDGHIRMTELRDAVMAADAEESDEAIEKSLVELKEFVFHNIAINITEENGVQEVSFGTGPFYLEHQYLRAANAALEEAEKQLVSDANPHGNVYGEASATCRARALANGWTWDNANYINCMLTEINKYPAASELQDQVIAALPSTELYRHNYASPVWAPTAAGWCLLVTLIIVVVLVVRIIVWVVLRLSLLFA